ncbi:MAG: ribose-phosphate pyrophosphokinase [Deltaproteobacteria bacterium]|nr:ribose-phosphate pyrophosphokinase [Deltaproteobacteria bacterium]
MLEPLIFSTAAYQYLGDSIAKGASWESGKVTRKTFPDGENYLRIESDPADRDVILVGGTPDDRSTLELYDLACGLCNLGAYRVRMVIPFFGYSTMERAVKPGEVVTAKTRARLLSSIPMASRGTQVFLLDLHVDAIAHYFEGGIRTVHVYGKPLVIAAAQRFGCDVLACTDAGRAKWVESLANDMNVPAAFVYKRRGESGEPEVTGVSAEVRGKRVVIYDDMIRTGGSLMNAARTYLEAGATSINAIATHGLFPGDSLAKLEASKLFGSIWVTDSHPNVIALSNQSKFLHVDSTAGVLIEHLMSNR